jgi:hypothetical protein
LHSQTALTLVCTASALILLGGPAHGAVGTASKPGPFFFGGVAAAIAMPAFTRFGGKDAGRDLRALRMENAAKQHPSESLTRANPHSGHRSAPSGRSAPEAR